MKSESNTTLTTDDYRYLYYGRSFQPGYSSMTLSPASDSIRNIYQKDSLSGDDYLRMEKYINMALAEDPSSLSNLNLLTSVYQHTGRTALYQKLKYKLNMVADAILSTGDGRSATSGWYVISIEHEYDILRVFGLRFGGEQRLIEATGPCDYLSLGENENDLKGLYFNVSITMSDLDKMLGGTAKGKKKKKDKD